MGTFERTCLGFHFFSRWGVFVDLAVPVHIRKWHAQIHLHILVKYVLLMAWCQRPDSKLTLFKGMYWHMHSCLITDYCQNCIVMVKLVVYAYVVLNTMPSPILDCQLSIASKLRTVKMSCNWSQLKTAINVAWLGSRSCQSHNQWCAKLHKVCNICRKPECC